MSPQTTQMFEFTLAALLTLCIFSYLYRDNPFYRFAEHIFAGISAGYYAGLIWHAVIVQQLWVPITHEGTFSLFVPGILGALMFTRFFDKISFLSRISIAFVVGNTAGISIMQQLHGYVLPQVSDTITGLETSGTWYALVGGWVIFAGVVTTLLYFYFSKEHKGALGVTARIGIVFIMVSFGAHFGYTVMGRVSLLIGRMQFLLRDWLGLIN